MSYPRKVVLDNPRLKDLLVKKGSLVETGRVKSEEIEKLEALMAEIDKKIQSIEKKVFLKDLESKAKEITDRFNKFTEEMESVKKEIYDRMRKAVPVELPAKYEKTQKDKEQLENERNKIALKVQQINDRVIPLGRKAMQPFLENEYEDYNSLGIEEGKIVGEIFSHLQEFETNFRSKRKT